MQYYTDVKSQISILFCVIKLLFVDLPVKWKQPLSRELNGDGESGKSGKKTRKYARRDITTFQQPKSSSANLLQLIQTNP